METQTHHTTTTVERTADSVDMKLEVVILPVADAERSKAFYESLGWRLDADLVFAPTSRVLQFTPTGSDASIIFGTGVTSATPGSVSGLLLAVSDIEAAHDDLVARGIDVSDVFHGTGAVFGPAERKPGPDPDRGTYQSFVSFEDPDGNGWLLQEVSGRAPGRVTGATFPRVGDLAAALRRAEKAHGEHEARTGEYDAEWPEWYATYMVAEQSGEELPA
ncbi:MAG TPA: VOC family protein [Solirubrobacteraceae bacterium]|jgi:catechol 2,3-dioxygenase-like lactoylglutathione lyase family enzyme